MRFSTLFILLILVLVVLGVHRARRFVYVNAYPPAPPPKLPAPPHRGDESDQPMAGKNKNRKGSDAVVRNQPKAPEFPKASTPSEPLWKAEVKEKGTSPQAARQEALKVAAKTLHAHLHDRYPDFLYTPTPQFLLDHKMVDEGRDEKLTLSDPDAPPDMTEHTLTVQLRQDALNELLSADRLERGRDRLWEAGRILGGLVVMLVALVGYVRLDDWTKGYISWPLKLSALSVAVAGPIVCWWLI